MKKTRRCGGCGRCAVDIEPGWLHVHITQGHGPHDPDHEEHLRGAGQACSSACCVHVLRTLIGLIEHSAKKEKP